MFAVDDVLISDTLVEARFSCDLGACRGACCVIGDRGAPLLAQERADMERAAEALAPSLRPEAQAVLAERGAWEEVEPGRYATTCVGDAECVFVVYERGVALCAIQRARQAGQLEVEKPVSCALFPIRVRDLGELWALNLEPIAECAPGHAQGEAEGLNVVEFLQGPLTRRFGEAFTAALLAEIRRQQAALRG
ncbi:MAG: DUF3109 family protein [Alphaproteobacteria bacterium]|nr:DUF3109 family protein [Alphaproteobacteria bacterium]MCB9793389.1 DUF3109 family protein [Alphaproteobacteria bacterium]